MTAVNKISCRRGEARQGEPCGGHLQDQEKYIIQQDNYTLGNTELPKAKQFSSR